jgi:hypothetical protein
MVLEQALAAARDGVQIGEYLAELGIAPAREPGDDPESWGDGGLRSLGPTALGGEPVYLPGYYICPRGMCTRAEYRTAGSGLPGCDVFDVPLRFTEER